MRHITYVVLAKPRSLVEHNACMLTSKAGRLITRRSNIQLLFLNLHSLDATTVTFKLTKECATVFVPKRFPTQVLHENRMPQTGPMLPFNDKATPKAHSVCSPACKCAGNGICCAGLHDDLRGPMRCDHPHNNNRIFSLAVRSRGCVRPGSIFHIPVNYWTFSFFLVMAIDSQLGNTWAETAGSMVFMKMLWEFLWNMFVHWLATMADILICMFWAQSSKARRVETEILNVIKMATLGGRKAETKPAQIMLVTMCSRISLTEGNGGAFQLQAIKGIQCICFQQLTCVMLRLPLSR